MDKTVSIPQENMILEKSDFFPPDPIHLTTQPRSGTTAVDG